MSKTAPVEECQKHLKHARWRSSHNGVNKFKVLRRCVLSYFSKKEIKTCRGIILFKIAPPTYIICSQRPRCVFKT